MATGKPQGEGWEEGFVLGIFKGVSEHGGGRDQVSSQGDGGRSQGLLEGWPGQGVVACGHPGGHAGAEDLYSGNCPKWKR